MGLPAQAKFVARRIFPAPDQEPLRQLLIEQVTKKPIPALIAPPC